MTTPTATAPVAQTEQSAPAPRRGPFLLQVLRKEQLSPSLVRIILGGESLVDYPADAAGAHIKVLTPRPGQEKPHRPMMSNGPRM